MSTQCMFVQKFFVTMYNFTLISLSIFLMGLHVALIIMVIFYMFSTNLTYYPTRFIIMLLFHMSAEVRLIFYYFFTDFTLINKLLIYSNLAIFLLIRFFKDLFKIWLRVIIVFFKVLEFFLAIKAEKCKRADFHDFYNNLLLKFIICQYIYFYNIYYT